MQKIIIRKLFHFLILTIFTTGMCLNEGFLKIALAMVFFDEHLNTLRRGLIELGEQPGTVKERTFYMAVMEKQLITDIVRYSDEGIGQSQACLAMVNNLSNALRNVTPVEITQGVKAISLGNGEVV